MQFPCRFSMIPRTWRAPCHPATTRPEPRVYPRYFGLKEPSFSITPDPQYLFLSEQHREALAHLLYGAGENGGFVLLTGEVGTGKTTICRAFLEQLPETVDVALVLNPAMTAIELMYAICGEFGVDVPAGETSVKALVDRLNVYLLDAHARGRHPVLMIDEAQNLRPKVLEQIRLLTNLETSKHKLLQIFLVGQPELRATLASPDLRQLNQRITARCHLKPLGRRETAAYVEHRIAVAGVDRPLFSKAALREVHRCSGGVPRLVNLICDRALLGTAVSRRLQVTPRIVRRAAAEVRGSDNALRPRRSPVPALALLVLLAAAGGIWLGSIGIVDRLGSAALLAWKGPPEIMAADVEEQAEEPVARATAPAPDPAAEEAAAAEAADEAHPAATEAEAAAVAGVVEPVDDDDEAMSTAETTTPPLEPATGDGEADIATAPPESDVETVAETAAELSAGVDGGDDAGAARIPRIALTRVQPVIAEAGADELDALTVTPSAAVPELVRRWGHADTDTRGCADIDDLGLACERATGRWSDLRMLDRPVALKLDVEGSERYAVIGALDEEFAVLHRGDRVRRMPIAVLDERWSGEYLILWQPAPGGVKILGAGTFGESVRWLRGRLAELPDVGIGADGPLRWDAPLGDAVRRFQSQHGLVSDGVAGPRTLILLNNALAAADVPRLSRPAETTASAAP